MMGTGPFAVPTFEALLQSRYEVCALVTRPERPARGRRKLPPNPMRQTAEAHGLPVYAPESINAPPGLELLRQQRADLFVVCDYGQILSAEALSHATLGGINLHGSLLPKYRGAAPINWALLNGDTRTGITVIHMTPRLDGGPMLVQRAVDVGEDEDAVQLEKRLAALGVEAVHQSIEMLARWDRESPIGQVQSRELVSKAPRLTKSDGEVDWNRSAREIFNQVRALKPWPATFTYLLRDGKPPLRLILDQISPVDDQLDLPAGTATALDGQQVHASCGAGSLSLDRLQPAGKRVQGIAEFLRGYASGATTLRFGSPDKIE